jgi:hypothetical protein
MKFVTMILLAGINLALAETPRFIGPISVRDGNTPITVSNYGVPVMGDLDGDGVQDLVVGQLLLGNIRFYRNVGSNLSPQFSGFQYVEASGQRITLPNG